MITDKLRKYVLPYLPYVFIFWFADKLGMAYRIAPGNNLTVKLIGALNTLGAAMASPLPSFEPFDMFVGAAAAGIIYLVVRHKKKNAKKYRRDAEYGSARWGTEKDILPYVDPVPDQNIILTATESLTMNGRPKNPKYARNKNVLVIGGSGSGKTRFFAKPNLMQLHSSYCVHTRASQPLAALKSSGA